MHVKVAVYDGNSAESGSDYFKNQGCEVLSHAGRSVFQGTSAESGSDYTKISRL